MKNENKNPYSNSDSLRAREHEKKAAALEEKKQNNSKASAIVFGGLFVGTAALYGLKFAGILPGFTLLHLGTLTLIPMIPALISIFAKGPGPVSTPVLLISLYMLAAAQDGLGFLWEIFFPAALLIIGVSILSNSRIFRTRRVTDAETGLTLKFPVWKAILCTKHFTYTDAAPLPGAFVTAICGSANCDLKVSSTEDEVLIDITALFGTVSITLPEYCNVDVKTFPIIGAVRVPEDNSKLRYTDAPTFRIRSRTVCALLDVRQGNR